MLYVSSSSPPTGSLTQPELQMSTEWAAAALDATTWVGDDGHDGPDASHAASCGAIAQALRELAGSGAQEGEAIIEAERARPVVGSIPRCGNEHGQLIGFSCVLQLESLHACPLGGRRGPGDKELRLFRTSPDDVSSM